MKRRLRVIGLLVISLTMSGCDEQAINDPYPYEQATANTRYTAFTSRPKHLDPAKSYSAEEWDIISQIYEPPLEYHYLKRPFTLQGLVADGLPQVAYDSVNDTTTYTIKILAGVNYQPHPAFVQATDGSWTYHSLPAKEAQQYNTIQQFQMVASRELTADDFVNQIKRLADPKVNSPIYGFLNDNIVGLKDLHARLTSYYDLHRDAISADHREFSLQGAQVIDRYTYTITIHGRYPQFKYWLAMPFFAPVPWEAVQFYAQEELIKNNLTLDWYPVGTGPFYLTENNPERRMVLQRNPNFHPEYYPSEGSFADRKAGYLQQAGSRLPLLNKVIYSLEREGIPYWNKFLQGYYDASGISSENFTSAVSTNLQGGLELGADLAKQGIRLSISSQPSIFYWGFNMLDDTVGGDSVNNRKLRKAISLALDTQEFITIFANGRGEVASGPIPPGIVGYVEGKPENQIDYRKKLARAKKIMKNIGYPNGRSTATGEQLQLYFDMTSGGDPTSKAYAAWMVKQFEKLGIDLIIRATDYNRFREKMVTGNLQIYQLGWNADYPDPENFLFLFYGPNGKVKHSGENASNYSNPEFDKLYEQMELMGEDPERTKVVAKLVDILQRDLPWVWGYYPHDYILYHGWNSPIKPNAMARNTLKFRKLDPLQRAAKRLEWNQPVLWPLALLTLLSIILVVPALIGYRRATMRTAVRIE